MEYLKLPKDYFSFNEDERVELANRVVFDKAVCMIIKTIMNNYEQRMKFSQH